VVPIVPRPKRLTSLLLWAFRNTCHGTVASFANFNTINVCAVSTRRHWTFPRGPAVLYEQLVPQDAGLQRTAAWVAANSAMLNGCGQPAGALRYLRPGARPSMTTARRRGGARSGLCPSFD
jgi:hypothetical protein